MQKSHALAVLLLSASPACGARTDAPDMRDAQTSPAARVRETALDRYVAAPDPAFAWTFVESARIEGATVSWIDLTSQTWLTPSEVDRTTWKHWLLVVKPDEVLHSTSLLFVSGGENDGEKPKRAKKELVAIALATRSVVVELRMVPNQPLAFDGDGVPRDEDDLVAYTWKKFLDTGDERWPARLPMTKSVVRAMDAVTAFCREERGGALAVDRFVVAGASKRGWTTWTSAAVDKRVVAICPMVIDVLNLQPSMLHHFQAYGFWAPAVGEYVEHGIMERLGTREMRALLEIEEPYEYRDRLTLPKLLVNSAGDQFFAPDSAQFYFADLPGVKAMRYVPNCDHSLKGSDAMETLLAWHHAMLNGTRIPRFAWFRDDTGVIRVRTLDDPRAVKLWQAHNPTARDFRQETLGAVWQSSDLAPSAKNEFTGSVSIPTQGFTASFIELTFDIGALTPLKLTTDVSVLPDVLPFPPPETKRRSTGTIESSGGIAR